MKRSAAFFPIALALAAMIIAPRVGAQEQDAREPIKIKKCQTITQPGSYELANNLTATSTNGNCLVIAADFVTIDLAGFTIHGAGIAPGGSNSNGILSAPGAGELLHGIAVRNGSVSNFFNAVQLDSAEGSIVERLRVFGPPSPPGGGIGISANGIVKDNTVVSIPAAGITATGLVTGNGGQGIAVRCPTNVTNNTAVNNESNLVLLGEGCNDTNNVAP
jgi:hypothetical protein